MLRAILTIVMTPIYTVIFGLPVMLSGVFLPGGRVMVLFGRPWARAILRTAGVRVVGVGQERLTADSTYIYLGNHQSNLDVLAILDTMPGAFRFVAKRSLFYIPLFGQCLWLMGMIPIDRGNRERAFRSLDRAAERIRNGVSVFFFPEGTRSPDGRLLPFKKGAFVIAARAGVPLVPVVVSGTARLLSKGSVLLRRGTVRIEYGSPLVFAESDAGGRKDEILSRVRAEMLGMLGRGDAPARTDVRSAGSATTRAS